MIKQNRVWVQSLTLRHTLAATQRRLHPLHHSQTPASLRRPLAPARPCPLTQIQISISWPASHLWPHVHSACAFICQSCESPEGGVGGLVWRFYRWRPPWKTSEDALVSLRQDKDNSCTVNMCLVLCLTCVLKGQDVLTMKTDLDIIVKLNIKPGNFSVSSKSMIHAM